MQYSDKTKYTIPVLTKIAAWWILASCLLELVGIPVVWQKWHLGSRLAGDYLPIGYVLVFCWVVSLLTLVSVISLLLAKRKVRVVAAWTITTLLLLIQFLVTPLEGSALEDHIYYWHGWSTFVFQRIPLMMYVPPLLLMFIDFGRLLLKKRRIVC